MMNMAIIQSKYGDLTGSQENAVDALKIFKKVKDTSYIGTTLNILGTNEIELGNINQSIKYLNKAIFFSNNSLEKNVYLNNKAMAFSKLEKSDSAFIILKKLKENNKINQAVYIDNLAYLSWKKNKSYNAENQLLNALQIRIKSKDLWGQNASNAHLADYYEATNVEKALYHSHEMFTVAQEINSPDDKIEALQKLIKLEKPTKSQEYFKTYLRLNDSLQAARSKAKNQFALVRYESEKNRADFLKAEAENVEKNYELIVKNVGLLVAALIIIALLFWYQKRKKRLRQEKELEIRNTELKLSKKVHDVVANGIYQVMSEFENNTEVDRNRILDKLEIIYEKSRDISYEDADRKITESFDVKLSELLNSFYSEDLKIVVIGNDKELWKEVPFQIKSELLIIIQELMVNAKKHSGAKIVKIIFENSLNDLLIDYSDNGKGFGNDLKKKNGLASTESRIFSCQGTVIFGEDFGNGAKIKITFPLNHK